MQIKREKKAFTFMQLQDTEHKITAKKKKTIKGVTLLNTKYKKNYVPAYQKMLMLKTNKIE